MKILTVIPIAKGVFRENLSYFTSKNIQPGALVSIPVRKKIIPAIVVSTEEIKKAKTEVRQSDFTLKPIKSVKSETFLTSEFVEACGELSDYFISPIGSVIKEFVPQVILDSNLNSSSPISPKSDFGEIGEKGEKEKQTPSKTHHDVQLSQAPEKERLQFYKSVIREEFAKKRSVFFCLPTISDMDKIAPELRKGIEKYSLTLHTKMTKKKIREEWTRAITEKHPLLIIATKSFLSIPRKDLSAIIIENESSPFYKSQRRPYADARKAAEVLARKLKIRLIFGDSVIRTETFFNFQHSPVSRMLSEAEQIISNTKKNDSAEWQKTKIFSAIGHELREVLQTAHAKSANSILFVNRRGHSPSTVCNDCKRTLLCEKCETPIVLHKENERSRNAKFVCHKCLTETIAPERCPYCNGWNLQTLGIGTQRIAEEMSELFPSIKLFRMDSDTIKTQKQGEEMAKKFLNTPGAALIGTEILFSYITQPVEISAIISIDALFTLPDFRINEKIFHLLLKLRSLAKKTFLMQTRMPEHPIFNDAKRGNISGFHKTEIEARKELQFPPFSILIKITKDGKNQTALKREMDELESQLKQWDPLSYPAFIPKAKGSYTHHILLKLGPNEWPPTIQQSNKTKTLNRILSSLSPAWKINVDPESLL